MPGTSRGEAGPSEPGCPGDEATPPDDTDQSDQEARGHGQAQECGRNEGTESDRDRGPQRHRPFARDAATDLEADQQVDGRGQDDLQTDHGEGRRDREEEEHELPRPPCATDLAEGQRQQDQRRPDAPGRPDEQEHLRGGQRGGESTAPQGHQSLEDPVESDDLRQGRWRADRAGEDVDAQGQGRHAAQEAHGPELPGQIARRCRSREQGRRHHARTRSEGTTERLWDLGPTWARASDAAGEGAAAQAAADLPVRRWIRKVAPPAGSFSTRRRPPWVSTIVRLIASPIPSPSFLVVKNGSKSRGRVLAAMPGPESCTPISTYGAATAVVHTVTFRLGDRPVAAALMALASRFRITCWICTRSPSRTGSAESGVKSMVTACSRASLVTRLMVVATRSLMRRGWLTNSVLLSSRRMRRSTSAARWSSLTMSARHARSSARSGDPVASRRKAAWALLRMAVRGWFSSWAIEAARWPMTATRSRWASSLRWCRAASSACRRAVTSKRITTAPPSRWASRRTRSSSQRSRPARPA